MEIWEIQMGGSGCSFLGGDCSRRGLEKQLTKVGRGLAPNENISLEARMRRFAHRAAVRDSDELPDQV